MKLIMQNKRGWLLVVEVVIAILIMFGFLFLTINRQAKTNVDVNSDLNYILDQAMNNEGIRDNLLQGKLNVSAEQIRLKLRPNLNITINNCGTVCIMPPYLRDLNKDIYSTTFTLVNKTNNYNKFIAYVWEK